MREKYPKDLDYFLKWININKNNFYKRFTKDAFGYISQNTINNLLMKM